MGTGARSRALKQYFSTVKELERSLGDADSLALLKILARQPICLTMYFCHEGCGGCDCSQVVNRLEAFYQETLYEELAAEAHYHFVRLKYAHHEEAQERAEHYERHLRIYPDSPRQLDVTKALLYLYYYEFEHHAELGRKKERARELLALLEARFPAFVESEEYVYLKMQYDGW